MSILGQFQFRRDIASNWTSVNPILLDGELGIESDTDKFKIGDGTSPWNGLMYGGIKGDTGPASMVPGPQGDKGWSPVLANVSDGERRVLRVVDYVGGEGTKPTIPADNYIGPTGFTNLAGATDIRGATGAAGATPNTFRDVAVSGQTTIVADSSTDTLTLAAGSGITITTDAANDTVTFASNINVPNAFTNFLIGTTPTPTSLTPDLAADTLSINAGSGISLTADAGTDTFSINNTGVTSIAQGTGITVSASTGAVTVTNNDTGTSAVNAHIALVNPHSQYSRLTSVYFYAPDYGTLTDGTDTATVAAGQATTNTNTIQAAINAAQTAGGGIVVLPPGTFHISSTLTINQSGVILMGTGAYGNTDASGIPQTGRGTSLFWNNTASPATTAMVDVVSPAGPTNPAVKNSGIIGITLQCAGNVGIGFRVQSIHWGKFKDIYIVNPTSRGVSTECLVTGTTLGEAADVTKCIFEDIRVRLLEAPAAAVGFYLDGASNANTSNSTFRNLAVSCQGTQLGLDIRNTDSNRFYDVAINQSNGATVQPVVIRGGTAAGLEARGNAFFYLAAGGSSTGTRGLRCEGTETAGVTAPSKNNVVYGYSIENGEPYPIIGTGSTLFYQIVGGTTPFVLSSALVADTAFTNTAATVATLTIPANALTPGSTFNINIAGSVINTTATSNLVVDILLNGAAVATATLALGTTAFAAPGRGFFVEGHLTIRTVGATGAAIGGLNLSVNAVAPVNSNTTATTAVNTTAAVTLAVRIGSSAATSTGTIRQASIIKGN